MSYYNIDMLYNKLTEADRFEKKRILAQFSAVFYGNIPEKKRPDYITAFMTVLNWMSVSASSGVWEYYDSCREKDTGDTIAYLNKIGEKEIAGKLKRGHSLYKSDNDSIDKIDFWCEENEQRLTAFLVKLLQDNKGEIKSLFTEA